MMFRFRRYRVFLIFAVFIIVILVRLRSTRDWSPASQTIVDYAPPEKNGNNAGSVAVKPQEPEVADEQLAATKVPTSQTTSQPQTKAVIASTTPLAIPSTTSSRIAGATVPAYVLPDRDPVPPTKVQIGADSVEDDIHPIAPPGRQEAPSFSAVPTTIHWERQKEHFPVPTESLIKLPTGSPKKIRKIQHNFNDETVDARITREKRQSQVKEEFQRAWNGYRKNAWLHDELSPVTGNFRDPFCGWAATLVDTLDTLWIMGLQEEFEEAANAVDLIDFTTSTRSDIPMFETTIRYLGGLLAAYDVSNHQYKNLLDKAVELADILMGAFDTPNRMPILYYQWKPAFASQPHRASQRSSLAEIGSLAMEFTRLAQLTSEPRYYDAVARITNALSEWQDRGTKLDGVFPDNVDASGCNRTAPPVEPLPSLQDPVISPAKIVEEPIGFQPLSPETVKEPKPKKSKTNDGISGPGTLEMQILPGDPGKAKILGWDDENNKSKKSAKRSLDTEERGVESAAITNTTSSAHQEAARSASNTTATRTLPQPLPATDPITGLPLDIPAAKESIGKAVGGWDCIEQGLEPASSYGYDKFSMGGGQDSTYEYFPKQYLLLGGLDETYRKMYMKTIEAIRKHMLYRPMTPENRDILFSGSIMTLGDDETTQLSADVEHLTCFIGGMVGMAAKIFDIEGDLEIAKKLTDGCVWAYESTASGIMPEGAVVLPCKNAEHCIWNETMYYEFLDPNGESRDQNVKDYIERKKQVEAEILKAAEDEKVAEAEALKQAAAAAAQVRAGATLNDQTAADNGTAHDYDTTDPETGSESLRKDEPASLQKRQFGALSNSTNKVPIEQPTFQGRASTGDVKKTNVELTATEKMYAEKAKMTAAELEAVAASGRQVETKALQEPLIDPLQPLGHKEYVESRIRQESLPPGFVTMKSNKYILRPEAIESVWYMYRITGDTTWQTKGWKMFTSIINATSTEFGHSAIFDVTYTVPAKRDEMESFWLAETLKYFYLLYSSPDTISLDEWVLNTEAHPFRRPT